MLSVFSSPPLVPFCLEAFSGVLAIIGKKNNTTHPHLIQGFSFFLFLGELLLTPNKIWKNCSEEIRRNICILFILVNGSQPIIIFLLLGGGVWTQLATTRFVQFNGCHVCVRGVCWRKQFIIRSTGSRRGAYCILPRACSRNVFIFPLFICPGNKKNRNNFRSLLISSFISY